MSAVARKKDIRPLLLARGLTLVTPTGRTLVQQLNLTLSNDKVAIVGRNGSGKSTLLEALAGRTAPTSGAITCVCARSYVPQALPKNPSALIERLTHLARRPAQEGMDEELARLKLPPLETLRQNRGLSRGELRKLSLVTAMRSGADLLLLDEPDQDLDGDGRRWLRQRLANWQGALIVVSHHDELLAAFAHFFVLAESGCRYFHGELSQLRGDMEKRRREQDKKYLQNLSRLVSREEKNALVARRRRRKKMGGRVREIGRAPSRALLNSKRSYAQESQGKRAALQDARIEAARLWTMASRRALEVRLSLAPSVPSLPPDEGQVNLQIEEGSLRVQGTKLFEELSLRISRNRIAITGPNGCGKTALLRVMQGELVPDAGRVTRRESRIAAISQAAQCWMQQESLMTLLLATSRSLTAFHVAERLVSHKFPLALAQRPMRSLSPGERVRAALLCIFERETPPELLLLDEPTYSLDQEGAMALREILRAYCGGIVVASHDLDFLRAIGIKQEVNLGDPNTPLLGGYAPSR